MGQIMRTILKSAIAASVLLLSTAASFANTVTYDLNNVTLSNADVLTGSGGTLTGFFTVDYTASTITNWSITASAGGGYSAPFTYNPSDSTAIDGLVSMYFQADDASNNYELRLYFPQGTTLPLPNGTSILTGGFSYTHQPISSVGSNRYVTGGTVVINTSSQITSAVPLPASFWLGASALASLALWKSRQKLTRAACHAL
jgi:hypothetical protein